MKDITESLYAVERVIKDTQRRIEDSENLLCYCNSGKVFEKKNDDLFDQIIDPILVMNSVGKLVFVNKAAEVLYAYTKQELLEFNIWDIDSYMTDEQCMYAIRRLLAGEVLVFDTEHTSKFGIVFSIEIHVSKITLDGCEYVLAVCRDITERKKLEERLKIVEKENEELQAKIIRDNYQSGKVKRK